MILPDEHRRLGPTRLRLYPIKLRDARAFVALHHRHRKRTVGGKFAVAIAANHEIVGVAIGGRPVAGALDDGVTLEITRCCVLPGYKNGCSMLYRAITRAAIALGYLRVGTYTLDSESGASLRGAGFREVARVKAESWSRKNRPRFDQDPLQMKIRWEAEL